MKIDGKKLSEGIITDLKREIAEFKTNGIEPGLAIITLGEEDSWEKYVGQKIKLAEKLGIKRKLINLKNPTEKLLTEIIQTLNQDKNIHGIIVQRPLTQHIQKDKVTYAVTPKKDIDGFIKGGYFESPIWLAVKETLGKIRELEFEARGVTREEGLPTARSEFSPKESGTQRALAVRESSGRTPSEIDWLKSKNIVVLGKGETAGQPVIEGLQAISIEPNIVDSKTSEEEKEELLKNADIVISAVGKGNVFSATDLKKDAIVIGIGLHRENELLKPDFNEEEVSKVAKYYTPTPGGIGPINLAYLFKNLINAAKLQSNSGVI